VSAPKGPPGGGLLVRLVGALVPPDRREEFLGDLLEEARDRPAVSRWLWAQALRSVPALVALRWSRLLEGRLVPALAAVGPRMTEARWPVPATVSLATHLLLIAAMAAWVLPRVDEVEPPAPPVPGWRISLAALGEEGTEPVMLAPELAEQSCRHCPAPQALGLAGAMTIRACVDVRGQVSSVEVLQGLGPAPDAQVERTVRGWRFSPHLIADHPRPFCFATRFLFAPMSPPAE
jgi:hypothetical protein